MRHNPDDLSQYISQLITSPPVGPLPENMKQYDKEDTMRKLIFGEESLYMGFSTKKRNELTQSLKFPNGFKTENYNGEDLHDPLYFPAKAQTDTENERKYAKARNYNSSTRAIFD